MKKDIIKLITVFFVSMLFVFGVDALSRPVNDAARVPSRIPEPGSKLYATVQDKFDFSKIKFSNGNEELTGYDSMRKIVFSEGFEFNKETGVFGVKDDWFTAYCLDGRLKYPEDGFYFRQITGKTDVKDAVKDMVKTAILNQSNSSQKMYDLLKQARGSIGIEVLFKMPQKSDGSEMTYDELGTQMLKASSTPIEIEVEGLIIAGNNTNPTISAAELNKAAGTTGDTFKIKVSSSVEDSNVIFNRYTTEALDRTLNYNRALWMIEHSYPTLSLEESLKVAGASYDNLKAEIKALHSSATDEELTKLIENYVYSTVQYAIWKVNDGVDYNGKTLGNKLTGSEELNKLYQYLIEDKGNTFYSTYGKSAYTEELSIVKPDTKKEIYEETNDVYKYGPYKVNGGFLETGKIYLSVKDSDKNGVKLVNKAGDTISEVNSGEEFYVLTNKKSKIANVVIEASAPDAKIFTPAGNRGRIYYANSVVTQNVITGGKIENKAVNANFELLFNPSTGVENVGMLFIVTLIAFTVGYLVLSHKNQPVQL
jgi:hypothetical protein